MLKQTIPKWLPVLAALLFAACGGGGSGGSADSVATVGEPIGDISSPDVVVDEPEAPAAPAPEETVFLVRPIDGSGAASPDDLRGSAGVDLLRLAPGGYDDGISELAGPTRPSARAVSNAVCAQDGSVPNASGATDFVWQWGQFVDHDITLTPEADPEESAPIAVPAFDMWFDPEGTGAVSLPFHRSDYSEGSVPRQQVNVLTAFIDAGNVYGSSESRAAALRALDGTGRLKTSGDGLLPRNDEGLDNAGGPSAALFLAGDVRANEQIALTAMHTLFVREHNRLADEIRDREPTLSGDEVYEAARRIVGAEMQVITYREFLPVVLGPGALPAYAGYDESVDPGISNEFSTGCYRFGHSMLSDRVLRLDSAGNEIAAGHLSLSDAFFNPELLESGEDVEPILRGLAAQPMQELDALIVDDVRNLLFGAPGAGGLDLAALNIQRGRDHGLPTLNEVRETFGLEPFSTMDDLTSDPEVLARLTAVYAGIDEVDIWVGALAEDDRPGALVGDTLFAVIRDQFVRLRDGDPFWYERIFAGQELEDLRSLRLSDVIRRNTGIGDELQGDVFRLAPDAAPVIEESLQPLEIDDERRERIDRGMRGAR